MYFLMNKYYLLYLTCNQRFYATFLYRMYFFNAGTFFTGKLRIYVEILYRMCFFLK